MNKLDSSKEHMKTLRLMSKFRMVLAKVKKSDMQCDENCSNTGRNRTAKYLPISLWNKPVIDRIGQSGVPHMTHIKSIFPLHKLSV